jgi:hypothetical protein
MKLPLLLVCLLPLSTLHSQLLENPGFEQDMHGWQNAEKSPVSSVVEDAAHEGKAGLRIADELKDGGANITTERFTITPGQKVTLSFWARSTKDAVTAVMIMPYTSSRKAILNEKGKPPVVVNIKKSENWERYEAEYTMPDEADAFSVVIRSWTGSVGTTDLDDFDLKVE